MNNFKYANNQQTDWKNIRFQNYPSFLADLRDAIAGERSAISLYSELLSVAPTEMAKYSLKIALADEKEHNRLLSQLYLQLTGQRPEVAVKRADFHHFYDGLKKSFINELKAFEKYKEMYLASNCPDIRDILYSIQHDEIKHATLFNWVHSEIKN